ncbi:MAG TPA: condensation domain-containing protein, partial [Longimicrobiaceae bacterium]|nr:condensation domain-containing protein [Longimicrobiaceae bacterium]
MTVDNLEDVYELSPLQHGILFQALYAPGTDAYLIQFGCVLQGALDARAFERAWRRVVERHSILRSSFLWEELEKPVQLVDREVELPWREEDWRGLSAEEQRTRLDAYLAEDRARGFDLSRPPLTRLALFRTADDAWRFTWSVHHLLTDGWSTQLILREAFACCEAFARGEEPRLRPARPFGDYVAWLQEQDLEAAGRYWRETLRGFRAPTPLGVDRLPGGGGAGFGEERVRLSGEATVALQALAREHRLTLNTLVQGAWGLLLSRYSGEEDVLFGATVSGRPAELEGVEEMVGLFINTLPVRVRIDAEAPAAAWLRGVQEEQARAREHEHAPLVEVQRWSELPGGTPLFESLLIFENYPVDASARERGGRGFEIREPRSRERTEYPLSLVAVPGPKLQLRAAYDRGRFDPGAIPRLLEHLERILAGIAAGPERRVGEIQLVGPAERERLLREGNDTAAAFPRQRCLHELFAAQAARTPGAAAVVSGEERVTYRELDLRANRRAHHLRRRGVGPEVRVGVCLERSAEMVVAVLAVLKAGGAYLPLDPAYPPERLAYMLRDADAGAVIAGESAPPAVVEGAGAVVSPARDAARVAGEPDTAPESGAGPENLAYVIYTSGSTGRPKGVMVPHRGVVNLALAQVRAFRVDAESRVVQFASPSFDAAVSEIYTALLSGAALHLGTREALL